MVLQPLRVWASSFLVASLQNNCRMGDYLDCYKMGGVWLPSGTRVEVRVLNDCTRCVNDKKYYNNKVKDEE